MSATAIAALERDFEDVIKDLGGEDNLERFRLEYEKLHRALKKSHESEKRLIKKCQELSQEIMANAAKVQSALKLSQDDQATIEALKKEIEKAWKMVDSAHEKEARAKETIQKLKKEAADLGNLVEQGASLTHGQEVSLAELTEEKKDLIRQRESLSSKISNQLHELREAAEKYKKYETDLAARDAELKKITEKLALLKTEYEREKKSKERADGQMKELMGVLQTRTNECDLRVAAIKKKTESIDTLHAQIREEVSYKQLLAAKYEASVKQKQDVATSIKDYQDTAGKCDAQIQHIKKLIAEREKQIQDLRYEEQKIQKGKDQQLKDLKKVAQEKDDIKKQHELLQRQIVGLEKQVEVLIKETAVHKKSLEAVQDDQAIVEMRSKKEKKKQEVVKADISAEELARQQLEKELDQHRQMNTTQRRRVVDLESEREKFAEDASQATVKYNNALEEVKIGLMKIDDLQKQIEETAKKQVEQQGMYEQVRSDRNLYSKNLIEAQDEISEMKQKFKIMDHQIDQLKEELSMKEKKYSEALSGQKDVKDRLNKMRKEVNHFKAKKKEALERSKSLNQEIRQLTKVINACDAELSQQQARFLSVTNERDLLGTQLIRRNDELALLYEKIRIQQSTLSKGEVQYRDRQVDIRMLRLKIAELKRNVHMSQMRVKNIEELKIQVINLQRQLSLERTKVQALSEELENPQNFLRWRRLAGHDLKESEMVQKIQTLQKRLIAMTEACVEKDIIVQEKEKLYIELMTILSRQPGPEVAEQLNVYQQDLRRRNVLMKSMASELNMSSTQAAEYRYEMERLNRELQEVKKHYFELKMTNHSLLAEKAATIGGPSNGGQSSAAPMGRTV